MATVFVCEADWEAFLLDELGRCFTGARIEQMAPAWIAVRHADELQEPEPIAFAQQALPAAERLETPSISRAADACGGRLVECLAEHDGPWRLHVFTPDVEHSSASGRRCQLIEEALDKHLAKKQRRLRRSRVSDMLAPWQADEWLIQVGLARAEQAWFSAVSPSQRRRWAATLSRFPGGVIGVDHDRLAPSRANGKLVEAELHLAESIRAGQSCIDLGASPGGWTYLAAQRGAQVMAVDRSPLRGDLMRHANVTFVEGDAFRFQPERPVDWLLCDVIAFPERTLELLQTWLENRWCRRFCVTIKFRRHEHYALLDEFKRLLAAQTKRFMLRRLQYNKNEITALGEA
jgi:23S rRNA (cytidine2498-2'-O)-methyltransferase